MVHTRSLFTALLAVTLPLPVVFAAKVQKDGLALPNGASSSRDVVKDIFTRSYEAYKKHAFGHDDLAPGKPDGSQAGFVDSRNGWGASIVDGMSTMQIMGLETYFTEAVDFASKIDFNNSKTADTVSVFETTIRYIGGLLSAYELSRQKYPVLVQKARQVADKLIHAWVGNNDIPFGRINFSNNTPQQANSNIAEAGTLLLEWATLSKYTGDNKYFQFAEKAMRRIATNPSPLPGLAAQGIDPNTGNPVGGYVTWGGGSDSYFEYLIKYARLNNTVDPIYADTWKLAVDSSLSTLLKTSTFGSQKYLADFDSQRRIVHRGSHLACFLGGNWIMGMRYTCWISFALTYGFLRRTGIGPETFFFASDDGDYTGSAAPTDEELAFYKQHGFYMQPDTSYYILRPEVLESNFYAWRATGDTKYLDRANAAIESFKKYLAINDAYAGIMDVNNANSDKINDMESFWFAETLKYLYLTFDDPNHISLDAYVFNTEAHPFKAPAPLDTYGSPNGHIPPEDQPAFTPTQAPVPNYSQSPSLPGILHIPELLHLL
ncbi:putative mannosyl-oligosaccharide alpha-1,2-mannosidase 1B [Leucoagaricus sp. SymC.cos]|nr:putative mannosyl-oligosaccharide alpha-1,2-mannosidase 1B [Leucoagaricus sp. SymC.cos]